MTIETLIILTVREIRDLAGVAGLVITSGFGPDEDELDTEIAITGEIDITDDDGNVERFAHAAYYADLPEEGVLGLGEPQEVGNAL